ncbi:MAG TPA: hypothetical protein VFQ68_07740, partial [Streptosporangiaceae bacterium]|nr:hypothetical protein [Streptosporangiaceae bacterium]
TAAAVRGIADTFARSPVSRVRWLVQMAITVAAGLAAGAAASRLLRDAARGKRGGEPTTADPGPRPARNGPIWVATTDSR